MEGVQNRSRLGYEKTEPGVWTVREPGERYGLRSGFQGTRNGLPRKLMFLWHTEDERLSRVLEAFVIRL